MKACQFLLIAAFCVLSFCPVIQQTLSATAPTMQPVADDVEDSDTFFQRATTRPAQKKNYAPEVSALLARMTLEEKVGQMTQLEIGMITKGEGDNLSLIH